MLMGCMLNSIAQLDEIVVQIAQRNVAPENLDLNSLLRSFK